MIFLYLLEYIGMVKPIIHLLPQNVQHKARRLFVVTLNAVAELKLSTGRPCLL